MRYLTAVLVALGLALGVAAGPAAAAPRNPSCATRAEYRAVKVGMPAAAVRKAIGGPGRMTSSTVAAGMPTREEREWKVCGSDYGYVQVAYVGGLVDSKHGLFI